MNQPYARVNQPYATLTLASALREMFGVQLYKNNARALLSRVLSILNLDWLQHARSVRGVYEWWIWHVFQELIWNPFLHCRIVWNNKCILYKLVLVFILQTENGKYVLKGFQSEYTYNLPFNWSFFFQLIKLQSFRFTTHFGLHTVLWECWSWEEDM